MPCPTWVDLKEVLIADTFLARSASIIQSQLGPRGIEKVGGTEWWQWRRPEIPMKAEWIEMKSDANERKAQGNTQSKRIILYVHGGAYYFGSTGEHRYQMQRHARKLKAQLLAPKYRLAPQFPFPCGLHDCIAAYLYLIQDHDPSTILLAGDSAGGGMVLSMLVTLRDQGIQLPAGAMLLSPWVDLTHSFPSVAGEGELDYIPANGFHHKPSVVWPPPNAADLEALQDGLGNAASLPPSAKHSQSRSAQGTSNLAEAEAAQGFSLHNDGSSASQSNSPGVLPPDDPDIKRANSVPQAGQNLSLELDGKVVEIQDQIQMYAANHLLAHPLVSPVVQTSLGGLPPLLIQVGGGELLRDEQIYIAHKAAHPSQYPPPEHVLREYNLDRSHIDKYGPTNVQLQVWDDLCHVPHTLSFTRPAKHMYRSVAQFGAWALAHAQSRPMTIMDDDEISVISSNPSSDKSFKDTPDAADAADADPDNEDTAQHLDGHGGALSTRDVQIRAHTTSTPSGAVGKAGDPLPPFVNHMIRQRIDRHGAIYPLPPPAEISSLQMDTSAIAKIKPGPVRKWIAKKADWDSRYAKEKRHVQKTRLKEMREGYDEFDGETPPPTALAGRRQKGMAKEKLRKGRSWGMSMWSGWGSKHDESTIERKKKINRAPTQSVVMPEAGKGIATSSDPDEEIARANQVQVSDLYHPPHTEDHEGDVHEPALGLHAAAAAAGVGAATGAIVFADQQSHKVEGSENTYVSADSARPHNGTIAYPFKLRNLAGASASTATLESGVDHVRPMGIGGTGPSSIKSSSSELGSPENRLDGTDDSHLENNGEGEIRNQVQEEEREQDTVGNEIGGHNWLISGRSSGKPINVAVQATTSDSTETKPTDRPPLQTFVTARESL